LGSRQLLSLSKISGLTPFLSVKSYVCRRLSFGMSRHRYVKGTPG
jgi:hypothetical protein